MKIGIITSGNDTLTLFKFLTKYDNEYIIYYDFLNRSYGDKPFEHSLEQIKKGIGLLMDKGCEKIIIPPIYEIALLNETHSLSLEERVRVRSKILPLFQTYLHNYCFTHSLVGKIGLFGDYADIALAQKLITQEAKTYTLNEHQKNIKKFHFPFDYRTKETGLRKQYLTTLSYSEPMVNKIVKTDLRYFKDANIDTAIPFNYGYFNYQNTIHTFFNFKKTRFHKLDKLEEIFINLCPPLTKGGVGGIGKPYSIQILYTGHTDFLQREKRLLRLLQRGKKSEISYEHI